MDIWRAAWIINSFCFPFAYRVSLFCFVYGRVRTPYHFIGCLQKKEMDADNVRTYGQRKILTKTSGNRHMAGTPKMGFLPYCSTPQDTLQKSVHWSSSDKRFPALIPNPEKYNISYPKKLFPLTLYDLDSPADN